MKKAKKSKTALVTGLTGQDGSYLAELLIGKGYKVHGIVRRTSVTFRPNIDSIYDTDRKRRAYLHHGDMTDFASLVSILAHVRPDEIYNLAAQSHVKVSFEIPLYTAHADAIGLLNLLEAIKALRLETKVYQASTSEMYSGDSREAPQSERTPFLPQSPYGVAKLYAHGIARAYRDAYGMFICSGILFNHESPRRGINFVTRKITRAVAKIAHGRMNKISLGNLNAHRDWGYAPEYMEAAWRMIQQDKPDDYVIATGKTHSIREFAEEAFKHIGIRLEWKEKGLNEKGIDINTKKVLVEVDPFYFRPNEVEYLCGNPSRAKRALKWKSETSFRNLVRIMTEADLKTIKNNPL
jgi:GDPmannose 4,6-dehydratase